MDFLKYFGPSYQQTTRKQQALVPRRWLDEHNLQYGCFNPHSPIGNRNYGVLPDGAGSMAYGSRFVRIWMAATIIK